MANSRNSQNYKNSFCWQHFRKRCRDLTPEERREFLRLAKAKSRDCQTEEQREMQKVYSKRYRENHREEIREKTKRYALSGKYRKKDAWKNTLCWKVLGKKLKEFTKEDWAVYRHLLYIGYGKSDKEKAKMKEQRKQWRIANKAKIAEWQKQYLKRKREKGEKGGKND